MADDTPAYEDETRPVDERVEDLLDRMTVAEKIGQLAGVFSSELQVERYEKYSLQEVEEIIREYAIGSVTPFGTGVSNYNSSAVVPRIANRLQRTAERETRLGIPLLIPVDAVHGHAYVSGCTIFPHNLGMAATWDPSLVRRAGRVTATEMRATGATQNYSPNADVTRDPRWGRTYETYGEAPYLVGEMAAAEVDGLQAGDPEVSVAATAKHFPAYGAPQRGEDAAPVDISQSTLHRVFVPPFTRTIDAGVASVMPAYSVIGDEPAHGSRRFLTDLLRDELGFGGLVVSDWHGVHFLAQDHHTAASQRDATAQATEAGLDVASIGGPQHIDLLRELVVDGDISEARLDESVRRVLRLKFDLGLFDDPYVDPLQSQETVGAVAHRDIALESARKSMVLLENDAGTLPLESPDEVLVTGPNAASLTNLCGGWTIGDLSTDHGTTVLDGLSDIADDGTHVVHEQGAAIREEIDIDTAVQAAAAADAAVVVLGENWYVHDHSPRSITGPSDEFPTRSSLKLPPVQTRLLNRVAETGTPTVLIVISGRPLAITTEVDIADAVLMGFYPGFEGGRAIAEILFGDVNPSGALPISVPRSVGHLPTVHDYKPVSYPLGENEHLPSYDPLFEFGHGLSYAEFTYESLDVSADRINSEDEITVTVTVANRGDRTGTEVIQLYVRDVVSSRVTPVRELRDFDRVTIPPGERIETEFTLSAPDLALVRRDGSTAVEPGRFEIECGSLSSDFTVTE